MLSCAEGKDDNSFFVDIVYLTTGPTLRQRGTVLVTVPQFDLPVCQLFVTVGAPQEYAYRL